MSGVTRKIENLACSLAARKSILLFINRNFIAEIFRNESIDEVSTFSLQAINYPLQQKLLKESITHMSEERLIGLMESEWAGSAHWIYVNSAVPAKNDIDRLSLGMNRDDANFEINIRLRDQNHFGWTLEDFLQHPYAVSAQLWKAELIALRLYTGPGYRQINYSCRCNDSTYLVTIFCANRGIGKLARSYQNPLSQYFRGMQGYLRRPFVEKYYSDENENPGLLGRLSDNCLMSTTSSFTVATSGFASDMVLVLNTMAKEDGSTKCPRQGSNPFSSESEGAPSLTGFEIMTTPAPVQWLSQFPHEEEYLWPTNTCLIPKLLKDRHFTVPEGTSQSIFEFWPFYFWDRTNSCCGRWKNVACDDLEFADLIHKLAAKGLGAQDAYLIPGILGTPGEPYHGSESMSSYPPALSPIPPVGPSSSLPPPISRITATSRPPLLHMKNGHKIAREIDEDFDVETALQILFCVLGGGKTGYLTWTMPWADGGGVLERIHYFFDSVTPMALDSAEFVDRVRFEWGVDRDSETLLDDPGDDVVVCLHDWALHTTQSPCHPECAEVARASAPTTHLPGPAPRRIYWETFFNHYQRYSYGHF